MKPTCEASCEIRHIKMGLAASIPYQSSELAYCDCQYPSGNFTNILHVLFFSKCIAYVCMRSYVIMHMFLLCVYVLTVNCNIYLECPVQNKFNYKYVVQIGWSEHFVPLCISSTDYVTSLEYIMHGLVVRFQVK